MRKRSNLIYLQLIFLLAVMFLTIYSTYSVVSAKAQPEINTAQEEVTEQPKDKPFKPDIRENMKFSKEINEYVKTVKNVSGSVCFVMFDQCYVAFKSEDLVDKEAISAVKKEIEAGILKKFNKIKKVFATNDMNVFVKMENIVKRIEAGEKITDLKEEIIELRKLFHGNKRHGHLKRR